MSSSLADFLTQIGAVTLPLTISLPPADSKPPLAVLHDRLQAEVNSVNVCYLGAALGTKLTSYDVLQEQTRELLVNEWPEFSQQFTTGHSLLARLEASSTELSSLEQTLHDPVRSSSLLASCS